VAIIRTVLHRNDGDSSAAMEMLKDFRENVCAHVVKCAASSRGANTTFAKDDVIALASAALDMGEWSPALVLEHARRLVDFTIRTKAVCALSGQPFVPAEHVIWALRECGESATPEVSARMILYGEDPREAKSNLQHKGQPGGKGQVPFGGKGGAPQKIVQAWDSFDGYISQSVETLLVAAMTVEEAKVKAEQMPKCQGFCHAGPPTNKVIEMHFKTQSNVERDERTKWTSFVKRPQAKAKPKAKRQSQSDDDGCSLM